MRLHAAYMDLVILDKLEEGPGGRTVGGMCG